MNNGPVSQQAQQIMNAGSYHLVNDYFVNTYRKNVLDGSDIADLTFGNRHYMPLQGLVDAIQMWSTPRNKDWYAYKSSEPDAQALGAKSLDRKLGMPFEADEIALTTGGLAAITTGLKVVTEPGDEVQDANVFPHLPARERRNDRTCASRVQESDCAGTEVQPVD